MGQRWTFCAGYFVSSPVSGYSSSTAAAHGRFHTAPRRSAHSRAVPHSRALPGGSAMSGMSRPAQTPVSNRQSCPAGLSRAGAPRRLATDPILGAVVKLGGRPAAARAGPAGHTRLRRQDRVLCGPRTRGPTTADPFGRPAGWV